MSGSALGEALEDVLVGASAFDEINVSRCDYGIMEYSGCALVITPGGMTADRHAYGGTWMCTWTLDVEGYVKVIGDPLDALYRTWTLIDEVVGAVSACQNLGTSACSAIVSNVERPRNTLAEMYGQDWVPVYFTITAQEVI